MKRWNRKGKSESGIALVITLIMLAIVTLMAIVFLAMTRRERASVQVMQDISTAQYMADAALERAKAQAIAQMAVAGSKLSYDLFVSTNFISPVGFTPQGGNRTPNPTNVSYVYANGQRVAGDDLLQVIANLQYDARVPVFITTNDNPNLAKDFRFFLDFDRSRTFETNGILAEIDFRGLALTDGNGMVVSNRFVGDPEWLGVLERPDLPHSETNRFVGRVAYIALPSGKTLSLNNIHNQANLNAPADVSSARIPHGFARSQGYGSWELNLAAFLRELNTNNAAWNSNTYFLSAVGDVPRGAAFDDAKALLSFRYNGTRNNLLPATALFNGAEPQFRFDGIDNYSDGPFVDAQGIPTLFNPNVDTDNPALPWPGSPTTNALFDVQELFTLGSYSTETIAFTNRLKQAMVTRPGKQSSYDRYTYYRMLSQMGVDATPFLKGKLHLNYQNEIGQVSTNLVPWTNAVEFFTKAADLMIKTSIVKNIIPLNYQGLPVQQGQQIVSLYTNYVIGDTPVRPDISVTNIQLYSSQNAQFPYLPGNEYSASVHRILQVAANIWDNMTNRWAGLPGERNRRDALPTTFRPLFTKTGTNLFISGFTEVIDASILTLRTATNEWMDLGTFATNSTIQPGLYTNTIVYGQPWVIGAKKGHPNFNELSVESDVQITRRLELAKSNASGPVTDTNVLYSINVNNIWGIEAWNSYLTNYSRNIRVFADIASTIVLSNNFGASTTQVRYANNYASATFDTNSWAGTAPGIGQFVPGNFKVPIYTHQPMLVNAAWLTNNPFLTNYPGNQAVFLNLHQAPRLQLYTTNRVRYWMVDMAQNKVIDFVTLDRISTKVDLEGLLASTNSPATDQFSANVAMTERMLWDPLELGVGANRLTVGMTNQVAVSMGDPRVYENLWRSYTANPASKNMEVDKFRNFLGLPPLFNWPQGAPRDGSTRAQTPFTPSRRFYVRFSWGADDPLVHYTATDMQPRQPVPQLLSVASPIPIDRTTGLSGNLGRLNERYRPWGGGQTEPSATNAFRLSLKDPGMWGSDFWDFPINRRTNDYFRFPSIGWLGQVHRGSPWQTIYLKSAIEDPANWIKERGTLGTHPIRDWRFLDVFTVAPNEAAASGLLSVNQTNRAAWSAVLSGLPQVVITNNREIADDNPPQYALQLIEPATANLQAIVDSINQYRATSTLRTNWVATNNTYLAQVFTNGVFESLGHVLGAPGLSTYSPYLWQATNNVANWQARIDNHARYAWTDEIVEQIPMQILSLLQKDEPRFTVYAFGQSLAPAPRSIVTSADFYNIVTNYQVTGEVITKTTFRVEGELDNPADPLRTVVESYRVLPPPE